MTFEADVSASAVFKDGVSIWSAADVRSALQSSSAATVRAGRPIEAPVGPWVCCAYVAWGINNQRGPRQGAEYAHALRPITPHSRART